MGVTTTPLAPSSLLVRLGNQQRRFKRHWCGADLEGWRHVIVVQRDCQVQVADQQGQCP